MKINFCISLYQNKISIQSLKFVIAYTRTCSDTLDFLHFPLFLTPIKLNILNSFNMMHNIIFLILLPVVVSYFMNVLLFLLCVLWETYHISLDFGQRSSRYQVALTATYTVRGKSADIFKSLPCQFYRWQHHQFLCIFSLLKLRKRNVINAILLVCTSMTLKWIFYIQLAEKILLFQKSTKL